MALSFQPGSRKMSGMSTAALILVAAVLPVVWGWAMHRLLAKLWPLRHIDDNQHVSQPPALPFDYQI
jgi:hypothetical protein